MIGGIPAHPLIIHAVVVLLPLAAVGAVAIAARPAWRRSLGIPVALIGLIGVGAVPLAVETGEQLRQALGGGGPLVEVHAQRAQTLLPFAVAFLILLLLAVYTGRRADRAGEEPGDGAPVWRRAAVGSAVLAAVAGIVVTGLVVWIGHAGSAAVWLATVS
ncbi:hypothetical protein HF519_14950 [Pseudonocardia bannensis]|uniref:DUF2231 domain-containing protein n=1 Tax=Pseudonocardia bannensis TaxID=630973 RepID=A0A848DJI0_9PSEU|nr:hypothetical protein [Pseudonocardia bannensis]